MEQHTMASTLIDSAIFQGIFSSDAMREVWSDENRTQKYLDVEAALARVQGRLGLIPQEAADEIMSHCQLEQIDMAKLRQQTERIGYPILGVVSQLNLLCRDKLAEVGAFLGLVGGTLGKLSMDVKLMMQTEVGEVYEPYAHGRGSSSTMPQKRNPISSCYIHAAVSVVRQHAAALMDAMVADHERSTGPWEIEWIVLPEAFCLMAGALKQSLFVLEGLEVDVQAMRRNIDLTHGLVMSEAVMM